ncbi:hypothetical protein [Spirosoma areae]
MDWQEEYEKAADYEKRAYEALPVDSLIEQISQGQFGTYNMIWRVLAQRATVQQVGWPFFQVLDSDAEYLIRCNCAEALLTLLGREGVMAILREAAALTYGPLAGRMTQVSALKRELSQLLGTASE